MFAPSVAVPTDPGPRAPGVVASVAPGGWPTRVDGWSSALADLGATGWNADEIVAMSAALARLESAVAAAQARLTAAADAGGAAGVDGSLVEERVARRSRREARRRARRARGLASMPSVAQALAGGRLSVEHADALVNAAENTSSAAVEADPGLLAAVEQERVDVARRIISRWVARHQTEAEAAERLVRQRRRREARWWTDDREGMTHYHVVLDPVVAAAVTAALDDETNRLWHHDGGRDGTPDEVRRPEQRRADAFARLVAGVSALDTDPPPPPDGATSGELIVTADVRCLLSADARAGVEIVDTGPVPATVLDALDRLAPGGVTVRGLIFDGPGRPLWLGRRRRLAGDDLRRLLAVRDRGCVACGAPTRWCEAHHRMPWSAGGTTDPDNLQFLCPRCHTDTHRTDTADGRGASSDRRPRRRRPPAGGSRARGDPP